MNSCSDKNECFLRFFATWVTAECSRVAMSTGLCADFSGFVVRSTGTPIFPSMRNISLPRWTSVSSGQNLQFTWLLGFSSLILWTKSVAIIYSWVFILIKSINSFFEAKNSSCTRSEHFRTQRTLHDSSFSGFPKKLRMTNGATHVSRWFHSISRRGIFIKI